MVNCFICESPFEEGVGVCCSRKCHNVRINSQRDYTKSKVTTNMQDRIEIYNKSPVKCHQCEKPLTYHTNLKGNQFCGQSCAATYRNFQRDATYQKRHSYKLKTTLQAKAMLCDKHTWPSCKVTFKPCRECNKIYRKTHGKLYCGDLCKLSAGINTYRRACNFKISKTQYPHLFDNKLLREHGWYRASNHPNGYNPDGATWDHLFRVEDGFKRGIDIAIMKHPANAEMISWRDNFARKRSRITYEELLNRIDDFNKRYGGP